MIRMIFFWIFTSCAILTGDKASKSSSDYFNFSDTTGNYLLLREKGLTGDKKQVVKKKLFQDGQENLPLEKSISLSRTGILSKVKVLIPESSQYIAWFDKKKFVSNIRYDDQKKQVMVTASEDGVQKYEHNFHVKDEKRLICFFSQLIECVGYTGFFKKAEREMAGTVRLAIIWDGHPYFQQQYSGLSEEVVSNGILYYDGNREGQETRYILKIANENITYFVNRKGEFRQMFWVSQGISMTERKQP